MDLLHAVLLWLSALGAGLLAGVYFAFSAFVMASFERLPPAAAIAAMSAINAAILRSPFMPLFFATTATAVAAVAVAALRWGTPGAAPALAAGIVFVLGMFGVTALRNVPLNDALAAGGAETGDAAIRWARYRRSWTGWNHVRTLSCTAAAALFIAAIAT